MPTLRLPSRLLPLALAPLAACGGGSGRSEPLTLTPATVDFALDVAAAERSLEVVERVFDFFDCEVQEGSVVESGRRRLLRFDTVVRNLGELDCVVGDPENPAPPLTPDDFHFHDCHGHYHFEGWANYELRFPDGTLAAIGHKQSFCITDSVAVIPDSPSAGFDCAFQGLSSGWADIYARGVPGQWVDVSGVAGGDYVLVIDVNPEGGLFEADDQYPNHAEIPITLPPPGAAVALLDDHADVPENATGMPTPAGFQASIQTPGDIDWFQVHALQGVTYVLRTSLLGLSNSVLRVYEADGTTLIGENDDVDPGVDSSSRVEITLDSDRDVKIQVTGLGNATGTYRLIAE
jgi:hypothetical protein